MNNTEFDKIIKRMADSHSEPVSESVWDGIEKGLSRRRRIVILKWTGMIAAAASLSIGLILFTPYNNNETPDVEVSKLAVVQIPVPEIDTPAIDKLRRISSVERKTASSDSRNIALVQSKSEEAEEEVAVSEQVSAGADRQANSATEALPEGDKPQGNSYFGPIEEFEEEEISAGRRVPVSIGIASNIMAANPASTDFSVPQYAPGHSSVSNYGITPINEPHFFFPMTFGLQLQFSFTDRLSLGIGANYTLLHSEYQALIDNSYQGLVEQNIHYVGVPLSLYFNVLHTEVLKFYVAAGGMFEKGIQSKCSIKGLNDAVSYRTESINGSQWSANLGVGLEYRFIKLLGIYLDPSVAYFFDCDQPFSIRTSQPLQFKLELGFRFHL